MTAPLAGVRAHLADTLAVLGVTVHTYPPPTPTVPGVVLVFTARNAGAAWNATEVGVDVRILVNAAGGAAAAQRLEDLIDTACAALVGAQVQVGTIGPYTVEGDPAALVADIPTTTVWKDE